MKWDQVLQVWHQHPCVSQFQVEQLSEETEEETVLLSVSTADGTLSHIGSVHGKDFLNGKDEIMFQFLNYCLKSKWASAWDKSYMGQ